MIVSGVKIVEGVVIRFTDDAGKRRPAIVLMVSEEHEMALGIEGTTRRHWKGTGTPVLLEVVGRTRLQGRMGLLADETTYFYARDNALRFIRATSILVHRKQVRSCPEIELRQLQTWAFDTLHGSTSTFAVEMAKGLEARLSTP